MKFDKEAVKNSGFIDNLGHQLNVGDQVAYCTYDLTIQVGFILRFTKMYVKIKDNAGSTIYGNFLPKKILLLKPYSDEI